ncbi:hypothetical protein N7465_001233 [Penicillium sp. CMV-2018d]|nr:hypothetical protein N7465_001233 [Penicillium sp. CMV-2018d]
MDPINAGVPKGEDSFGIGFASVKVSSGHFLGCSSSSSNSKSLASSSGPFDSTTSLISKPPMTLALQQTGSVRSFIQWAVSELLTAGSALATIQNQTITPNQVLLSSVVGTALDIELAFVPQADAVLSLAVRKAGSRQTVIQYKQSTATLSVDRTASGDTSYDPAAGGVHSASLKPDGLGLVRIRVLVDTCSVEVLEGRGRLLSPTLSFQTRQQMA